MTADIPERLWFDMLREKHECFEVESIVARPIVSDGETIELLLPDYFAQFSVRQVARAGKLVFVLASNDEQSFDDKPLGVLIVGSQVGDSNVYEAHIWHELYPWVFQHLGLDDANGK